MRHCFEGLSFWGFGGSGYVTDLTKAQAEVFTKDGACDHRDTDIPWPKAYIDAQARRLVERDDVNIKDALRGTGIKLAKPKGPKMMVFNCNGYRRFISGAQRYREDRRTTHLKKRYRAGLMLPC
ncbi:MULTISPECIES: hypothetical protein [unclassified Pseudomonas]|uniref:hypothetical protein n=1 Tax=unclassified Pseudomonas TaxID=196821 RepID=UPI0030DBF68F